VKKAIRKLKKGNNILIFPEGTVHGGKVGHLVKAKTGVIRIGILSKTPIIPIGIKGSYQTWKFPETKPTFKNFISFHPRHLMEIKFGNIFKEHLDKKIDLTKKNKNQLRVLTDKLMKDIGKLSGQKYIQNT